MLLFVPFGALDLSTGTSASNHGTYARVMAFFFFLFLQEGEKKIIKSTFLFLVVALLFLVTEFIHHHRPNCDVTLELYF